MTIYKIYVGDDLVHECDSWYEAHNVYNRIYGIDEWSGLPIHVTINGVPQWGNTPEWLENHPEQASRLNEKRTHYLRSINSSEQERQASTQQQLATIVTTIRNQMRTF